MAPTAGHGGTGASAGDGGELLRRSDDDLSGEMSLKRRAASPSDGADVGAPDLVWCGPAYREWLLHRLLAEDALLRAG